MSNNKLDWRSIPSIDHYLKTNNGPKNIIYRMNLLNTRRILIFLKDRKGNGFLKHSIHDYMLGKLQPQKEIYKINKAVFALQFHQFQIAMGYNTNKCYCY